MLYRKARLEFWLSLTILLISLNPFTTCVVYIMQQINGFNRRRRNYMGSTHESGSIEPDSRNKMYRWFRSSNLTSKSRCHGDDNCAINKNKHQAILQMTGIDCVYIYSCMQSYIQLRLRHLSAAAISARSRKSGAGRPSLLLTEPINWAASVPASWEGPWQCSRICALLHLQIYYSPNTCANVCVRVRVHVRVRVCVFVCLRVCDSDVLHDFSSLHT